MELRGTSRYGLSARANFSWEVPDHGRVHGEGITRDLSALGAFVVTSTCPPIQTAVHVDIALPSLPGMTAAIRLTGMARVIRVDRPSEGYGDNGFAILTDDLDQWTLMSRHSEPNFAVGRGRKAGWKYGNKYLAVDT